MGVINTTPDSFSDGGSLFNSTGLDLSLVLARARAMIAGGASILDIGGESTRPGAAPVSEQEELDRVIPCVEAIRAESDIDISADTSSPTVMREAVSAGATMINDVRALGREGALEAAVSLDVPVCLMHMQGEPGTMQDQPSYGDVTAEVSAFLLERARSCESAGLAPAGILLDPGFGFGKTLRQNLQLLKDLPQLVDLGYPVLVGLSRKSMIGKLLGREVEERLPASIALALLAAGRGASIIRTHDVRETADALAMAVAVADPERAGE
jgi:dihydropteroate synthase